MAVDTIEAWGGAGMARKRQARFNPLPYALILPAACAAFAIAVVPLAYDVWLSFQDWYLLRNPVPAWGGLINYRELLTDDALWSAFIRTVIWTLGTVAVEIAIALPLALLLNRETPIARLASAVILLPWVMPFIVLGYGWRFLLDSQVGPIHHVLHLVGLAGDSNVFTDPNKALAVIIFISGWKGAPFLVLALLAALKAIPSELYEAAAVDGAGPLHRFAAVTFPAIRDTLVIISLVLGILAFYSFDLPWIMTKGGPGDATTTLGIAMFKAVFVDLRPAYAAAISIVMLVLLFASALLTLRLQRRQS
ncbi:MULTISPECIES: carbohydrate ABC transporter permease [unclassified Rhizobium]|uniref:carbohydrate ABC transporter permease n=1 Tax=unclassified Rhizobium TaxID=2613769 RepID=UPI001ADACA1A|nr:MULTISPECIES: sugar ABC transporter permease [unclassified Rhizobium]MBO9123805.1 sugar ABC transporter permease [Rhizobium sp. 16-488-2b]MBO9174337.1 sugar ABC transporter permease [Rhizobium sp. 16-488-2a]